MNTTWSEIGNCLVKEFVFTDFASALRFINQVGQEAERIQHHPDILLYNYCHVKMSLSTHDQNKIAEKDYSLAQKIDTILAEA